MLLIGMSPHLPPVWNAESTFLDSCLCVRLCVLIRVSKLCAACVCYVCESYREQDEEVNFSAEEGGL